MSTICYDDARTRKGLVSFIFLWFQRIFKEKKKEAYPKDEERKGEGGSGCDQRAASSCP